MKRLPISGCSSRALIFFPMKFRIISSAVTTALVCATASVFAQSASDLIILDDNGARNLGIQTVEAEERRFETTVFAIGRIEEIPARRSVLSSRIAGRVIELNAFEGDTVEAGQVLARVESRQLGDPPPSIDLKAPIGGLVVESHASLGQPVDPEVELLDIADRMKMWAVAKIPEQEAARVSIGSKARIRIPALGEQAIEATLERFGVDADRQAGTVEGVFVLDNADGQLRPGLRAEFSIVLSERFDVLAVPIESIQGDPSNRVVFVEDFDLSNAFYRSPVILGERNDRYIEILSGIFPGDEVVTSGSYLLGYAGGNSGISLKEALDAAHGHEHNEDGSEITPEQRAQQAADEHGHGHAHGHQGSASRGWIIYSVFSTLLCIGLAQALWNKRRKVEG